MQCNEKPTRINRTAANEDETKQDKVPYLFSERRIEEWLYTVECPFAYWRAYPGVVVEVNPGKLSRRSETTVSLLSIMPFAGAATFALPFDASVGRVHCRARGVGSSARSRVADSGYRETDSFADEVWRCYGCGSVAVLTTADRRG